MADSTPPAPDAPDPTRVVADADVLAADLLVGGDARDALDVVRSHSWIDLLASDPLLADATAIVESLADAELADAWREKLEAERVRIEHPEGDHPGLATAHRGDGAQLLTLDETLVTADVGVKLGGRVQVSVRTPAAFLQVVDPEALYASTGGGTYPGPDRDPRA